MSFSLKDNPQNQYFTLKSIDLLYHIIVMVPSFYPLKQNFVEAKENDGMFNLFLGLGLG